MVSFHNSDSNQYLEITTDDEPVVASDSETGLEVSYVQSTGGTHCLQVQYSEDGVVKESRAMYAGSVPDLIKETKRYHVWKFTSFQEKLKKNFNAKNGPNSHTKPEKEDEWMTEKSSRQDEQKMSFEALVSQVLPSIVIE